MADEPDDDDFDDLSLPDFDEEIEKATHEVEEEEESDLSLLEQAKASDAALAETASDAAPEAKPTREESPLETAPAPIEGSRDDLDFALTVELGRVSIPMSKLLDLEQGNILELGVSADQGVDLVIGGRCIGRGELVKIGPKIAVRILSIK